MHKKGFLALSLLMMTLAGCKNELHLNAPYKELPSIYAVISPNERVHVIRINKVFLGEGDANAMAQIHDSVNYPQGELEVTLTRFQNDVQVDASPGIRTIVFRDDSLTTTVEGAFNTSQRLYVSKASLFTSGEYRLSVHNKRTGNTFTARSGSLDRVTGVFRPLSPAPQYPYPSNTNPVEYIHYESIGGTVRFEANAAKVYQLKVRTHYFDSTLNAKSFHYLDFDFNVREERTKTITSGVGYIVYDFRTTDYWNAMGLALQKKNPPANIFGRRAYMIEYLVYSSTQDYVDYLAYSAPSFGLTQNSVIYSNFDDKAAIGIFTIRTLLSVKKEPASEMINEFARNPNTCAYRFYDSKLVVGNCPQ